MTLTNIALIKQVAQLILAIILTTLIVVQLVLPVFTYPMNAKHYK